MSHMASFTLHGNGFFVERRVLGIRFFRYDRVQKWTDILHGQTVERGVRIGHVRFSFTTNYNVWRDAVDGRTLAKSKGLL